VVKIQNYPRHKIDFIASGFVPYIYTLKRWYKPLKKKIEYSEKDGKAFKNKQNLILGNSKKN
jgi:hypothetical protein